MPQSRPTAKTPAPTTTDAATGATPNGDQIATALGRIPSGLFVVTWKDAGQDRGMLASWVMQAGFVPPTITIAIAPGRELLASIDRGEVFTVNVLGEGQRPLLARFGRPVTNGDDPFAGLAIDRSLGGNAVLADSAGWLECRPFGRVGGDDTDHVIVLAEIVGGGSGPVDSPLVHLRKNGLRY